MAGPPIRVAMEVGDDGVAVVTFRNPPVNALHPTIVQGLEEKYTEAMGRDDVKAIVLTALLIRTNCLLIITRETLVAGGMSPTPDASVELLSDLVEGGKKPSVAAIQGLALGGGLELAMSCHARISTPEVQLGLPELTLGIIPGLGGTQRLPRLVGLPKATEMLLKSKFISAKEGEEHGLIDAVCCSDELINMSRLWALEIANYPKVSKQVLLSATSKALIHVFFAQRSTTKVPGITDVQLKPREIRKVAIIGGGLMGSGIATALLVSNISVVLKEVNSQFLQRGQQMIAANLESLAKRGLLTKDKTNTSMSILKGTLDYSDFKDVDMVIEAVTEKVPLKQSIFFDLEKLCPPHCILATNTSTIDLNVVGEKTKSQDRIIGAHFFSPAHIMPLLEIVRTEKTSPQVILDLITVGKMIKKVPVVAGNCTGFAVNRTFFPYGQGSCLLVSLGIDVFRIDRVISSFGMPMGPFQLQDVAGYGVPLAIKDIYATAFGTRNFNSDLLDLMVENGRQGKSNGKGYYIYEKGEKPKPDPSVQHVIDEYRRRAKTIPGGKH
ncbi:hypothetical protein ABZP36_032168 [Zizania latifolia]